jgi:hypothetical protein
MIGATLYIVACTAANRLRRRLRRLREPRYLIGAVVGLAYLYVTLFFRAQAYRVRADPAAFTRRSAASSLATTGPPVAGVLLACAAVLCWLLPFTSSLLNFSQAEISLLFAAPVTRRGLVLYRLIRSQVAVLTGALIVALAYPTGSAAGRLRGMVAMWLLLMTCHVFFTGVNVARGRLRQGWMQSAGALLGLLIPVASVAGVGAALAGAGSHAPLNSARAFAAAAGAAATSPAPSLLLWPFTSVVRPIFETGGNGYLGSLVAGASVYAATVVWLLWMDALSDWSGDAASGFARQQPQRRSPAYSGRPVAWTLSTRGRPEAAFIWKAALQTFRVVDRRVFFRIVMILVWMMVASLFMTRVRGVAQVIGLFAAWGAGFATVMAPQVIRIDLRQDLAHLELLKTWPVRGAAVVFGELAWPAMLVTIIAWTFGIVAMVMIGTTFRSANTLLGEVAAVSILIVVPGIVFVQYAIHNAVALFLPGWVPLGTTRPRGVDAMGQRLILLSGTWLALAVALVPGAAVTLVLWMALRQIFGPLVLIAGAGVTVVTLGLEFLALTALLGPVYERLDMTSVERPE